MTPSIRRKLEQLAERHHELGLLLSQPEILANQTQFKALSREFAQLEPVATTLARFDASARALDQARELAAGSDREMAELAESEIESQSQALAEAELALNLLLLPQDPRDAANIFLEVRKPADATQ